ncbi:DoxX family membrane protein [Dyadobacter sp. LHD-138]|uniref:DoxX family protein n=1 Tax=Dyadobacter sp. LHD-138 TaxID=3071413 RepID=UPI0027E1DAC9|nr:DoxX family membrane protein [Dyadobacter sp. LHD-138]MDQ6478214.1 DoxX family membrane protein [Dyadobacter sp. LHD-138]
MNSSQQLSFLFGRLAIGMSMFGHGLVRLPKLAGFSAWMVDQFEKSVLPDIVVIPFSYILPITEFLVGVFLLIGLFTRQSLIAGALVMIALIFGTTMIEEWGSLGSQLIHVAFFSVLLIFEKEYNFFAVDLFLSRIKSTT